MTFRSEDKYILQKNDYIKLKCFLKENYFTSLFPNRKIKSLYFDNKYLNMFHDSEEGVTPRKKIRIRTYNNDENNPFLEFKINSAEGKFKKTESIEPSLFKTLCKSGKYDNSYGTCLPKLYVEYNREYLSKDDLRVTIDKEINYKGFLNKSFFKERFFLFEIKTLGVNRNSNFKEKFSNNKIRFSKYSEAIKKLFANDRGNIINL